MPLYTFVFEYAGGTYVSQVTAASPTAAVARWAVEKLADGLPGLAPSIRARQVEEASAAAEAPTPIEGLTNVWCATALVRGKLGLINIVQTSDK